jgi:hypothetical protein
MRMNKLCRSGSARRDRLGPQFFADTPRQGNPQQFLASHWLRQGSRFMVDGESLWKGSGMPS